jgi:hypothetical protein
MACAHRIWEFFQTFAIDQTEKWRDIMLVTEATVLKCDWENSWLASIAKNYSLLLPHLRQ